MNPLFKHLPCMAVLLAMLAAQAEVWAADKSDELDYFQAFPEVISASRLQQPLSEAPSAMTVIDRKMIEASGLRNIPDLFKLVPGMYVSYYSGTQAIVSYHGTVSSDAPGMQVMLDGISVYLPPFNTVDWALLPITTDDIERIEVIRGPAAASYGENSVRGVINIITRDAGALKGASVSYTRGNKGITDVRAQFGKRGEKLDYRMSLAYTADNGYDDLTTAPNDMSMQQAQQHGLLNNSNDSNRARLMNLRASYHPDAVDDFNVQLGFNRDIQGVGFWDSNSGLDPMHDMTSYSNTQQFEWVRRTDNSSEMRLRYYHIHHSTSESFQLGGVNYPAGAPSFPVSTSMKTERNEIEFQHTLRTSESNRLVYGAGYRQDQIDGNSYYPPVAPGSFPTSFSLKEFRVFANDEWRFGQKLTVNAGGMLENDAMDNRTFSPRLSLSFHLTPQHTLRMGASVAYRTPSLGEQYANGDNQYQLGSRYEPGPKITSAGLSPEKILSREIGYLSEFHDFGASLDLRIFHDQMSNMIYAVDTGWQNGMNAGYRGIEATLKQSFREYGDLTVNGSTMMVDSNSASLPNAQNSLSDSVPRSIVSLLYSRRLPNDLSFSAAYYFQTGMLGFDRGSWDFQPTHRRVDIRLSQPFKMDGGLKGEVAGVVQNLFGTDYTEYVASALFNRRAYITVKLDW